MSDPQADADRLLAALDQQCNFRCDRVDITVLRTLSDKLRANRWQVQVRIRDGEVIALGDRDGRQLGLAVDLGTTKIAGYLVDLTNGRIVASEGMMNPQISYGEDIISRVTGIIRSPEKGPQMQRLALEAINELALGLAATSNTSPRDIVDAVVVANTAMHHILLRLPVRQLALSPYVPAAALPLDMKARDVGLEIASGAYVHFLPNIAGFVGADHVAALLATGAVDLEVPAIILDIGTNTEVSLANGGELTAVSCASGPAFEGGHIEDGMRAATGAIERIQIKDGAIQYQTIGEGPPAGICGSGILDGMAQLHHNGIIDDSGRMKENHHRVRIRNNRHEFVLVSEEERRGDRGIVITQQDIRELQLAKAAIRTGIQVLLESGGIGEEELQQVIIAGAFGTYINISSAIEIGMLPSMPLGRFRQVGNAAGMGAKLALVSQLKRTEAQRIAGKVRYIELAGSSSFRQNFVQASYLGKYRIVNGHREKTE